MIDVTSQPFQEIWLTVSMSDATNLLLPMKYHNMSKHKFAMPYKLAVCRLLATSNKQQVLAIPLVGQ